MSSTDDAILNQLGIEGTYILTSAPATSIALAPAGATYTAFTGELLTLLRTGVPDGPTLLTFATIYRRLLHTMTTRGLPRPGQRGTGTVDQLALTRNPSHGNNPPTAPRTDRDRPPRTSDPWISDWEAQRRTGRDGVEFKQSALRGIGWLQNMIAFGCATGAMGGFTLAGFSWFGSDDPWIFWTTGIFGIMIMSSISFFLGRGSSSTARESLPFRVVRVEIRAPNNFRGASFRVSRSVEFQAHCLAPEDCFSSAHRSLVPPYSPTKKSGRSGPKMVTSASSKSGGYAAFQAL